jgi:hypothetical protein
MRQTILLSAFLLAYLGLDCGYDHDSVLATYERASKALCSGSSPYWVCEEAESAYAVPYKYPPIFALITWPVWKAPNPPIIWACINIVFLVYGLSRWCDLKGKLSGAMLLGLLAFVTDTLVALDCSQATVGITGLMLVGLDKLKRGKKFLGGMALGLASVKIYPALFLLRTRSVGCWLGVMCVGALAVFLPACVCDSWAVHKEWVVVMWADGTGVGLLDLRSALERAGLELGWVYYVAVVFGLVVFWKQQDWRLMYVFGVALMLLSSPRTEPSTYVMLAPGYLMLPQLWLERGRKARAYAAALVACLIASARYLDPSLYYANPYEIVRPLGALALLVMSFDRQGWAGYNSTCETHERVAQTSASSGN